MVRNKVQVLSGKHRINETWTEEKLIELGKEIVEFVRKNENVYHLSRFTESKNKDYTWWRNLKKKYDILVPYHNLSKELLANRLIEKNMSGLNCWVVQNFIPRYLKDFKDEDREELEYKTNLQLNAQMKFEKYKHELGQKSHDEMKAKIDSLDASITGMSKLMEYEKILKEHGLLDNTK